MRQPIHKNDFILLSQTSEIDTLFRSLISVFLPLFHSSSFESGCLTAPLLASLLQNSKSRNQDTRTTVTSCSSVEWDSSAGVNALRRRRVTSHWGEESRTPVRRSCDPGVGRRR